VRRTIARAKLPSFQTTVNGINMAHHVSQPRGMSQLDFRRFRVRFSSPASSAIR